MDFETKREKIISCHGKLKAKSVAKIFKVSRAYISTVWAKAGCYEEDLRE